MVNTWLRKAVNSLFFLLAHVEVISCAGKGKVLRKRGHLSAHVFFDALAGLFPFHDAKLRHPGEALVHYGAIRCNKVQ